MRKFTVFFGFVVLLTASVARADLITYENSVNMLPPGLPMPTSLTLNKFDTSLGTLTGIYITLTSAMTGLDYQYDNDSTGPATAYAYLTLSLDQFSSAVSLLLTGGDSITASDLGGTVYQEFSLNATTGDSTTAFNATGLDDYYDWNPGTISVSKGGDVSSSVWSDYEGSGTFAVTFRQNLSTYAGFLSGTGFTQKTDGPVIFSGSVTYEYTAAIPEPATISLIALSGLATMLGHRIRRRNAA